MPVSRSSSQTPARAGGARTGRVDALALVGALVAHGVVFGGATMLPPVRQLLGEGSSAAGEVTSIEILGPSVERVDPLVSPIPDEPRAVDAPSSKEPAPRDHDVATRATDTQAPARTPSPAPGSERAAAASEPSGPVTEPAGAKASSEGAEPGPARSPGAPDEYDAPPPPPAPTGLSGMLGAPAWSIPGAVASAASLPAPTTAPERAPVDRDAANRVIASTLRSRDKKAFVDVPAAPVVASTVATTMRTVSVPHNTRATFEVRLGPGGKLLGARVLSSSGGDASQWDAAAKTVASSLSKQTLALGADADKSGAIVKVVVTQKHVFAAGTTKGADVRPKCANGFINDIVDAADKDPHAPVDPKVPMFQDEHGRPCVPIGVAGVSDLANLGSQKQIQVESSFSVVIPGQVDLPSEIHEVNTDAPWIERGKEGPRPTLPQKVRKYMRDKEKKK
jgi:hypothetical protein